MASKNAQIISLNEPRRLTLESGRQITIHAEGQNEVLEVIENGGEVMLRVRLTEEGPVLSLEGARLELKGAESVVLEGKRVTIRAEEEAIVESEGRLTIDSKEKMDIRSDHDVQIVGRMIYLN